MPMKGPTYFYLDCAKTAAGSIMTVLVEQFHGIRCPIEQLLDAVAAGKFIFTSVRDPYERCLSLWWALNSPNDRYGVIEAGKTAPADLVRFLASGEFACSEKGEGGHCDQTYSQICRGVKLDAVIRYESLLADFNALPFVKVPVTEMPIVGRKRYGRPERWPLEDPEFRHAVEEWCAEDFEQFNYKRS